MFGVRCGAFFLPMGESSFNATPIGCPRLRGALLLVRYFKPFQTSYHYAYRGISNHWTFQHFCCISQSFSKEHSLLKAHILIELVGFRTKSRFLRVINQFKMIGYLASYDIERYHSYDRSGCAPKMPGWW